MFSHTSVASDSPTAEQKYIFMQSFTHIQTIIVTFLEITRLRSGNSVGDGIEDWKGMEREGERGWG
jgi:hypothetical protein